MTYKIVPVTDELTPEMIVPGLRVRHKETGRECILCKDGRPGCYDPAPWLVIRDDFVVHPDISGWSNTATVVRDFAPLDSPHGVGDVWENNLGGIASVHTLRGEYLCFEVFAPDAKTLAERLARCGYRRIGRMVKE